MWIFWDHMGDHGNWKMMVKNGVVIGIVNWKIVVLRHENRVKHGGFTMKKIGVHQEKDGVLQQQ